MVTSVKVVEIEAGLPPIDAHARLCFFRTCEMILGLRTWCVTAPGPDLARRLLDSNLRSTSDCGPMKYHSYELAHTMLRPWRAQTQMLQRACSNPLNPVAYTDLARKLAASCEVF